MAEDENKVAVEAKAETEDKPVEQPKLLEPLDSVVYVSNADKKEGVLSPELKQAMSAQETAEQRVTTVKQMNAEYGSILAKKGIELNKTENMAIAGAFGVSAAESIINDIDATANPEKGHIPKPLSELVDSSELEDLEAAYDKLSAEFKGKTNQPVSPSFKDATSADVVIMTQEIQEQAKVEAQKIAQEEDKATRDKMVESLMGSDNTMLALVGMAMMLMYGADEAEQEKANEQLYSAQKTQEQAQAQQSPEQAEIVANAGSIEEMAAAKPAQTAEFGDKQNDINAALASMGGVGGFGAGIKYSGTPENIGELSVAQTANPEVVLDKSLKVSGEENFMG